MHSESKKTKKIYIFSWKTILGQLPTFCIHTFLRTLLSLRTWYIHVGLSGGYLKKCELNICSGYLLVRSSPLNPLVFQLLYFQICSIASFILCLFSRNIYLVQSEYLSFRTSRCEHKGKKSHQRKILITVLYLSHRILMWTDCEKLQEQPLQHVTISTYY